MPPSLLQNTLIPFDFFFPKMPPSLLNGRFTHFIDHQPQLRGKSNSMADQRTSTTPPGKSNSIFYNKHNPTAHPLNNSLDVMTFISSRPTMARSPSSAPPSVPSSPLPAMSYWSFSPKRPWSLLESVLSEARCVVRLIPTLK
jgi:hypothetical protein